MGGEVDGDVVHEDGERRAAGLDLDNLRRAVDVVDVHVRRGPQSGSGGYRTRCVEGGDGKRRQSSPSGANYDRAAIGF